MSEATAAIRRAIHDGASREEFIRIARAFDRLTPEEIPQMLAFAAVHLDAWPEAMRIAQAGWWKRIARGEDVPAFRFARGLELEGEDRSLALALGASPFARQLLRIHLRGILLGDDGASEILRSDRLMQLEHLALIDAEIGPAGVRALSKAKLRPLASLDLSGNPLTADAIEPLLRLIEHGGSLSLSRCGLDPEAARKLAACDAGGRLASLDLSANDIGDAGAGALSASGWLGHLSSLSLASCGITPRGVRAISRARWVGNLTAIDLSYDELGDFDLSALGSLSELRLGGCNLAIADLPPSFAGIRRLALNDARIDPSLISAIATPERESLELAGSPLTLAALTVLSGSLRAEHLDLSRTAIGDAGVALLASGSTMSSLVSLSLANDGITPDGLEALLSSERTSRLSVIDLSDNPLGPEGARRLAESPLLDRLTGIRARNCGFTREWIEILRQKNENCRC